MSKRTLRELAWSMLDELKDAYDGESLHPITYSAASRRAGVDPQETTPGSPDRPPP